MAMLFETDFEKLIFEKYYYASKIMVYQRKKMLQLVSTDKKITMETFYC